MSLLPARLGAALVALAVVLSLALAGSAGAVYEIGALRALDLLSVNRTVNQFDVYVGTSAGAFVASLAANGVTPEEMMRVVNQQVPTPFRDIDADVELVDGPVDRQQVQRAQRADLVDAAREAAAAEDERRLRPLRAPLGSGARPGRGLGARGLRRPRLAGLELDDLAHLPTESTFRDGRYPRFA